MNQRSWYKAYHPCRPRFDFSMTAPTMSPTPATLTPSLAFTALILVVVVYCFYWLFNVCDLKNRCIAGTVSILRLDHAWTKKEMPCCVFLLAIVTSCVHIPLSSPDHSNFLCVCRLLSPDSGNDFLPGLFLAPMEMAKSKWLLPVPFRNHTAAFSGDKQAELQPNRATGGVPQQQYVSPGLEEGLQEVPRQQHLYNQVHSPHLPAPESLWAVS